MTKFKQNEDMIKLIKGKRVTLVGPSPHLVGKNIGNIIDSYDTVCRVNDYFPGGFESDYGSRTDINFDGFDTRGNTDTIEKMFRYEEDIKKIKLIVAFALQADHESKPDGAKILKNMSENNIYNLPTWWIGVDNFNYIESISYKNLNSGLMTILILLLHKPKELFLTGFSFYLQFKKDDSFGSVYRQGYYLSNDVWINFNWANWTPEQSHNINEQIQYFKNKVLTNYSNTVKIDSYLKSLLKINYHNVQEL